jgi:hypothetical protein
MRFMVGLLADMRRSHPPTATVVNLLHFAAGSSGCSENELPQSYK